MTPERQAELLELEHHDAIRRAKAAAVTKAWRLRHPDYVKKAAQAKRDHLKALRHEKVIHDAAVKAGDITMYDPSMDQIL